MPTAPSQEGWLADVAAAKGRKSVKTSVTLRYEGPALDAGRMDVYEASANMIAFSEFMVAAVKATYGDAAVAKAEVSGFDRGSFATDIVIQVAGTAATLFTALDPKQLWTVVKEAFELWKMLKGLPPKSVAHEGQHVTVTNNSGQIIQVRTESLTLVLSDKGSAAAQQFVKTGLDHEGYVAVKLEPDDHGGDSRSRRTLGGDELRCCGGASSRRGRPRRGGPLVDRATLRRRGRRSPRR